jgi:hypothetical protein
MKANGKSIIGMVGEWSDTATEIDTKENLKTTKSTLENANINWLEWCEKLRPENTRYTLVNEQGLVLCDTSPDKKGTLVKDASEIQGALKDNFHSQVRYSDIYKTQSLFAALKINDSMVIRKIVPITSLKDDMNRFDRVIFFRIVPIAFLSYVIFLSVLGIITLKNFNNLRSHPEPSRKNSRRKRFNLSKTI